MKEERPINHLSVDGQKLVAQLVDLKDEISAADGKELSQSEYARTYLPFSDATWAHLRQDDYVGNTPEMERMCREACNNIRRQLARRSAAVGHVVIHKTQYTEAVMEAIDRARLTRNSANRLVVYLSPTGGGKSLLCSQLKASYNAITVEGRESWRQSYTAGCKDVALAAGAAKDSKMRDAREAEEKMLECLSTRAHVLTVDEGNTFGPQTCNMLKLILNTTRCTVFLAAIPGLWDKMRQANWFEASQLQRRAVAVIRCEALESADVKPFLSGMVSDRSTLTESAKELAKAASQFGMFDLVSRVVRHLQETHTGSDPITSESVLKAIVYVRRTFGPQ